MVKRRSSKKRSRKGKGIPLQLRAWHAHLKECGAKYPDKTPRQRMQICKKTYKKTGAKSASKKSSRKSKRKSSKRR